MKVTTLEKGGKKYEVHLEAAYGEYNCGNKTTGRLTLVVTTPESGNTNVTAAPIADLLAVTETRNEIIEDYLENLTLATTFKQLNNAKSGGAEFFPHDTGTYPPGVLIYCDSVRIGASMTWYNNWKALFDVLEANPQFGAVVLKSPILPNRFYGPSKPSRIWTLVLPSIAKHVCWDKDSVTPEMKKSLGVVKSSECYSDSLRKELIALGV